MANGIQIGSIDIRQLSEQMDQIIIRLEIILFGNFNYAVYDGAAPSTFGGVRE